MRHNRNGEHREILNSRPTQTGQVRIPRRKFMDKYVEHIKGCDVCLNSFTYHFMTEFLMGISIIKAHRG